MQNGILFVTATMPRSALGVARSALSGAGRRVAKAPGLRLPSGL
jgi:hypothetical protein